MSRGNTCRAAIVAEAAQIHKCDVPSAVNRRDGAAQGRVPSPHTGQRSLTEFTLGTVYSEL